MREGEASVSDYITAAAILPGLVLATDAAYHPLDGNHPVRASDTIILWSVGLGQTNPAVAEGAASPANPLARAVTPPSVQFGTATPINPVFAGLAPGYAGLFQVNVTLPANTPKGNLFVKLVHQNGAVSNALPLAIE